MERLVIVADPETLPWRQKLHLQVTEIARQIGARNIVSLIEERMLLHAKQSGAESETEIVLWAMGEENILAAWTNSASSADTDSIICNPDVGLVAEVLSTKSFRSMDEPVLQAPEFTNLGDLRGKTIYAMRGLPVLVFGQCVGVLTSVDYRPPHESILQEENLVAELAQIFARVAELKILKMCLAMDAEL